MPNIQIKLFVGIALNRELFFFLQNSLSWKLAKFHPLHSLENPLGIREVRYQEKEFWGLFLEEPSYPLEKILFLLKDIRKELLKFLPELEEKKIVEAIFPQTFLT